MTDGFAAFIPIGRAINPVSGTNWEGIGVPPDVAVPATDALASAQVLALRRLLEMGAATPEGVPGPLLDEVQRALEELTRVAPQPPELPAPAP